MSSTSHSNVLTGTAYQSKGELDNKTTNIYLSIVNRGNGFETCVQSSPLYFFVGPVQNVAKYKGWSRVVLQLRTGLHFDITISISRHTQKL